MSRPVTVTDRDTIELALTQPSLIPHGTSDPSEGSTIALRRRMARFSGPDQHLQRRALVEAAVDEIDVTAAERIARTTTSDLLRTGRPTVDDIAITAPTATLIVLLELPLDPGPAVRDVEAVVRVLGRGESADDKSDAATDRLLAAVPETSDATTIVSLLYQNFDATAALVRTTLAARQSGHTPEPAVRATRRVAVAPVDLAEHRLDPGAEIVLEIGAAGLPFGAGPHVCPGRELAEAIVRGIVAALDAAAVPPE